MGREVRRVPADWQHPKRANGNYIALFDGAGYADALAGHRAEKAKWDAGEFPDYAGEEIRRMTYEEWNGEEPNPADYMPQWPDSERTHLMMYEDTSEGTPISPAFKTPEELARWLVDNGASSFGSSTGTYEGWLNIARGGWTPDMIVRNGVVSVGVDSLATQPAASIGRMGDGGGSHG